MKQQPFLPPIQQDRARLFDYSSGQKFADQPTAGVFTEIYQHKTWDGKEAGTSVSGKGSSYEQTTIVRKSIQQVMEEFDIQTLLDAPCGDFHWMSQLAWHHRKYLGADIVAPLVEQNRMRFESDQITFLQLDIIHDPLPTADMMLCRDCLVHLSFDDIHQAINNICQSPITYLLMTTFPEQTLQEDITTGGWRPLNFQKPPFSFPEPLLLINEACTEMNGAFRDKSLGLWKVSALSQC